MAIIYSTDDRFMYRFLILISLFVCSRRGNSNIKVLTRLKYVHIAIGHIRRTVQSPLSTETLV